MPSNLSRKKQGARSISQSPSSNLSDSEPDKNRLKDKAKARENNEDDSKGAEREVRNSNRTVSISAVTTGTFTESAKHPNRSLHLNQTLNGSPPKKKYRPALGAVPHPPAPSHPQFPLPKIKAQAALSPDTDMELDSSMLDKNWEYWRVVSEEMYSVVKRHFGFNRDYLSLMMLGEIFHEKVNTADFESSSCILAVEVTEVCNMFLYGKNQKRLLIKGEDFQTANNSENSHPNQRKICSHGSLADVLASVVRVGDLLVILSRQRDFIGPELAVLNAPVVMNHPRNEDSKVTVVHYRHEDIYSNNSVLNWNCSTLRKLMKDSRFESESFESSTMEKRVMLRPFKSSVCRNLCANFTTDITSPVDHNEGTKTTEQTENPSIIQQLEDDNDTNDDDNNVNHISNVVENTNLNDQSQQEQPEGIQVTSETNVASSESGKKSPSLLVTVMDESKLESHSPQLFEFNSFSSTNREEDRTFTNMDIDPDPDSQDIENEINSINLDLHSQTRIPASLEDDVEIQSATPTPTQDSDNDNGDDSAANVIAPSVSEVIVLRDQSETPGNDHGGCQSDLDLHSQDLDNLQDQVQDPTSAPDNENESSKILNTPCPKSSESFSPDTGTGSCEEFFLRDSRTSSTTKLPSVSSPSPTPALSSPMKQNSSEDKSSPVTPPNYLNTNTYTKTMDIGGTISTPDNMVIDDEDNDPDSLIIDDLWTQNNESQNQSSMDDM